MWVNIKKRMNEIAFKNWICVNFFQTGESIFGDSPLPSPGNLSSVFSPMLHQTDSSPVTSHQPSTSSQVNKKVAMTSSEHIKSSKLKRELMTSGLSKKLVFFFVSFTSFYLQLTFEIWSCSDFGTLKMVRLSNRSDFGHCLKSEL